MQTIILAAGLGTGMRPLSIDRPKVLAPICNQTLLARTLKQLHSENIKRATLVLRQGSESCCDTISASVPAGFELNTCFNTIRTTRPTALLFAASKSPHRRSHNFACARARVIFRKPGSAKILACGSPQSLPAPCNDCANTTSFGYNVAQCNLPRRPTLKST